MVHRAYLAQLCQPRGMPFATQKRHPMPSRQLQSHTFWMLQLSTYIQATSPSGL
ncbi:hypothetical protein P7K49_033657 [Saguinus oedipus]|uniref:Uncharacterized protein n=1 Tax=Saguinus oedipus TaxID=9490 RepID=A0ABQ9TTD0_SAGOE|nr:hypothetical protein P7K49_033657 [Saguinus oedipus]